ncbi:hypothetical protein F2Q68_00043335 [Brassica cretica]|uniref:Replication protein A 70 kDa DNA-binding subunit B/D first OB fold domain-containing protein n=1 Tax=Brassica cretica TaxID=69181 RepID=A0A8S9LK80_BRACR|nr:hypothetical protein F2Q68_00043335 [Brassica cretica]
MEFVLADETGQKIHATCKMTYIESKGRILTVGAWRYIRNFQITHAGGAYRTTDHTWKMVFNQNTAITRSNHLNDELYLNLTDFQSVLSGTLDENFLIDVLGQVMDCGDVENIQCTGGKQQKKLEFTLSDIDDSRLPCCIWGNLAGKLHSAISQEDGMVTMLLRFAKLGRFRGELQISNAFDASQMIINPSIPEAEAFKELINDDDKTLTSFQSNEDSQEDNNKQVDQLEKRGQRDKWLLFPTKSIQEMIRSTQVDRCLVRCTVYAIDMDWSWYYFGLTGLFFVVGEPHAGNFVCKWSPSCFLEDHVDIWGRGRCHMYDGMYPFELGVVPLDIILERSGFTLVSLGIPRSSLWESILTGERRSCLRACYVRLSNPA